MIEISDIIRLHDLARKDGGRYTKKRFLFSRLSSREGRHFMGIVGPRGVGKSILLKQLCLHWPNSFYVSLDALGEGDLFDLARILVEKHKVRVLLIDEIHFQKDYPGQLKKIHDFLPVRVVFSSSVSLSLYQSTQDLSRRVELFPLYPFSFREFISFKKDISLPPCSWDSVVQGTYDRSILLQEAYFDEYLQGGLMPFSLDEPEVLPLLRNVLTKVITKDVPSVGPLMVEELPILERLVSFVGRSAVDGINYSSLSSNLGITKYKAEQLVGYLKKAFVLNVVFPEGTNVMKEPKILMHLPYRLLFRDFQEAVGGLREDFFTETMDRLEVPLSYLKTNRGAKTPDFLVRWEGREMVVEVGGKGKGHGQFKGVRLEKSLILTHPARTDGIRRPLLLMGFLERSTGPRELTA